ncbi:hypothetical protein DACRYDRAFT_112439 [Dacryopinax primogenitus]|uniref:Uncharacterized protein n=1 Tax=Dacryopinax primogenitus (strain DJM 731) TaxID=1858805 RepID=M5FZ95_DACPD|nr:uncharacterized protein DACRYDRAFT_112439 [Dacryopinax primogenitus]EJT96822.1 hypothetical protein DACRYDRAFT_112439 [Dacryopinax primogenitus]
MRHFPSPFPAYSSPPPSPSSTNNNMGGPNLELFKFAVYVFFPVAIMFHYGNPDWYEKNVAPLKDQFWPREDTLNRPPHDNITLQAELARFKAEREARRERRQAAEAEAASASQGEPHRLV